jgi:allantoate deiminase
MTPLQRAHVIMQRLDELGRISDDPAMLVRTFLSPAMKRANDQVGSWMTEAGLQTRVDCIGNLIGHLPSPKPDTKTLLLGSHLDTVRDAGKYDGPLGVLLAIACLDRLQAEGMRLPFHVDVLGFSDEEGVCYQSTYLGSRAVAGTFDRSALALRDEDGVTMADAIRQFGGDPTQLPACSYSPANVLGYVEVHIEQGPVLETANQPIGIVTAIAGQTRCRVEFTGTAGHAGTVPMALRKDALCASAEFILTVEAFAQQADGLVATVGQIDAKPGASNVIPGRAILSLDVRDQRDEFRLEGMKALEEAARDIAKRRSLELDWREIQSSPAVPCSARWMKRLAQAATAVGLSPVKLPSGAGHDAVAMSALTEVAMLFVRCKGGVSHNPAESVTVEDVAAALTVMDEFLSKLAADHAVP